MMLMTARRSVIVQMDGFFLHLWEELSCDRFDSMNYLSAFGEWVRGRARWNRREVESVLGNISAFMGL